MDQVKPSIRWGNVVRKRPDGADFIIQPRELTPNDLAMLDALSPRRHRTLNANYLAALTGLDEEYARKRLAKLRGKGNNYVKLADWQTDNIRANVCTTNFYELDDAGEAALIDEGYVVGKRRPIKQAVHQVMQDQIAASIEIGTLNNPKLKLGMLADILSAPTTPKATKEAKDPAIMTVALRDPYGKSVEHRVRKDWFPFYVERVELGDYFFAPGFEADTASESIKASDFERSSIFRKFSEDIAIMEGDVHLHQFGAHNCFFFYIFTTLARKKSAMDMLEGMTRHKPSLRKNFCFKTHPKMTMREAPRHTGHMINEDWDRVGYAPFNFLTTKA